MIVVEGPDGAGKTTLIKEVMCQFSVTLAPRVVSTEAEAMLDLKTWVEEDAARLNQGVVFDRHRLISEPIYGPILRPTRPEPGFDDLRWLTAMSSQFYAKKPTIIYCLPPWDICIGDNHDCWPSSTTPAQARAIYSMYVAKAANDIGQRRAVHYDYTEGSAHMKSIMGYINREEMF